MFAYCLNNPIMYIDPDGYCTEVGALLTWVDCGKRDCPTSSRNQPTRYYGGDNNAKHKYYVRNHEIESRRRQLEMEIAMEQTEIVEEVIQSDGFFRLSAGKKMLSGGKQVIKGAKTIMAPVPTPIDEVIGITQIVVGAGKFVYGFCEIVVSAY